MNYILLYFDDFLLTNLWWIILLAILLLAALGMGLDYYFSHHKKERKEVKKPNIEETNALLIALGGAQNVLTHALKGSRIVLTLKDYEIVDKSSLEKAGVISFLSKSDSLTLVTQGKADALYKMMFGSSKEE